MYKSSDREPSLRLKLLLAAFLMSVSSPTWAQSVPPSVAPGAIERGLQSQRPEFRGGEVFVPPPHDLAAPDNAATIRFTLKSLAIEGATALPADRLAPTYRRLIGRYVSLADLYAVANAITGLYAKAGYAISFAVVPAQTIGPDGHARIAVVEGYVSEIGVNGASPRMRRVIQGYGAKIMASRPLRTADLERFLLLANQTVGATVRSVFNHLQNGPQGATRLDLNVSYKPVQASLDVDNRGTRALGSWRAIADLTIDSPLGLGDALDLRGLRSLGNNELSYGAANWSIPINHDGGSLDFAGSYSSSKPGTPQLSDTGFVGTGWIASAGWAQVLRLTRSESLSISVTGTGKWLDTNLISAPNSRDRIYTIDSALNYAGRDASGETSALLRLTKGLDVFDATTATSPLRSRSSGSGDYFTLQLSVGRLQNLGGPFQLDLAVYGQLASRGLLASEQCGYGGASFGRAFDDYELAGDHCLMGSAELRYSPVWARFDGAALQFYGSADAGFVSEAGTVLPGEVRGQFGESVGAGVRANLPKNITASLEVDQPLSRDVTQTNGWDQRVFFTLAKAF